MVEHFPEEEGVPGSSPGPSTRMGTTVIRSLSFKKILTFLSENERKLGALLFALGFLTDLLTFGLLPAETINWFFIAYLTLAGVTTLGTHGISTFTARDVWWKKTIAVVFPLGAQYAFGGLFSGFVVFYARSSVFAVSWPFLLLLLLVYAGNEYYRKEREHVVFQTVLFFTALYAYAIFALPLYVHTIGPWTFLGSTLSAIIVFCIFSYALFLIHKKRLLENLRVIGASVSAIVLVVCLSYFSGLIPPLPLALTEAGVYHSLEHVADGYRVQSEFAPPWWHIGTQEVHTTSNSSLTVFSAVHAPIAFSNTVLHRWEHYDEKKNTWVTQSKIEFSMSGGRAGGYRGYSTKGTLEDGEWRVSVETTSGQTIGRIRFNVKIQDVLPPLQVQTR